MTRETIKLLLKADLDHYLKLAHQMAIRMVKMTGWHEYKEFAIAIENLIRNLPDD
jgi:hypothetical protein